VTCVESFNLSLKTFDFALYMNVNSNHIILLEFSLPQHEIVVAGNVVI
jgi:hypothetical protein